MRSWVELAMLMCRGLKRRGVSRCWSLFGKVLQMVLRRARRSLTNCFTRTCHRTSWTCTWLDLTFLQLFLFNKVLSLIHRPGTIQQYKFPSWVYSQIQSPIVLHDFSGTLRRLDKGRITFLGYVFVLQVSGLPPPTEYSQGDVKMVSTTPFQWIFPICSRDGQR